ncbi:hypothetical protein [Companilactobacillus heilongjiangensis]|uniref:Uncharacterized protein n=1 Tax=Companilactobacillus heilongjiangensis TaxID=1074467 RepID=A0A0K2LDW9_9LACO|nr:hypothetical protein [Companilactobacillus heilongjiangensis]ALB29383.1 hypothetical protein JP39_08465 [Companilactobacillus heilongjiangensis]
MTLFKIILGSLLVIIAIPMYIIGFRSNRKSNKLRKNIGDIEIWKMSIILAQEYPKEYKRNKQNSRVFLFGYIILIISLTGLLVSLYTLISYMDSTITVIAALVGIVADILIMIFYRRVLETKLETQNSLKKVSDPEVQEKLSKFINANQLALKGGKYLLPSFLFLFIALLVFLTL